MMGTGLKLRLKRLTNQARDVASGYSNVGKWNSSYLNLHGPRLYADETTYRMAADFLADMGEVEDWGCGSGGFRRFCRSKYIGVDGSVTPYADKTVDLCSYHSSVDGILIRHVLEHNYRWRRILKNALRSFNKKLCIVVFTPFAHKTHVLAYCDELRVPDISFRKDDLTRHFVGVRWYLDENIQTDSEYSIEHVFRLEA